MHATLTRKAEQVKFTGTDALGRRWENGKLVAAKEEPAAQPQPAKPPAPAPAPRELHLNPTGQVRYTTPGAPAPAGYTSLGTDPAAHQMALARLQAGASARDVIAGQGAEKERPAAAKPPGKPVKVASSPEDRKQLHRVLGREVSDEEVGRLACAAPGATVTVERERRGKHDVVMVRSYHEGVDAARSFERNGKDLVVINSTFYIRDDSPHKGRGHELFAQQVRVLQQMGANRIVTCAAGYGSGHQLAKREGPSEENGYYTWPRLGYDGPLEPVHLEGMPARLRSRLGPEPTIQQLFVLEGGKEWWHKNGAEICLRFDLTPDSPNLKILEEYGRERAARK
jgi:hypothetical protein